jgi:malate/lactate dehydrogenase
VLLIRAPVEARTGVDHAAVVAGRPDEVSGADVVVVKAEESDEWGELVRDRAPNAVVIVIGGSPHTICETTLFPRARIIGVEDRAKADAIVETIASGEERVFETVVRCQGERGLEDEFARVPVRVGSKGVLEIIED